MTRKQLVMRALSYLALFVLLGAIVWLTIPFGNIKRNNPLVLFTFAINGISWTLLLVYELKKAPFSFAMIHWCFCLLFFFFAALVQYLNNSFPWIGYRSDDVLLAANLLLSLWTVGMMIGLYTHVGKRSYNTKLRERLSGTLAFSHLTIFTVASVLILLWRIRNVGFVNLLSRGTSSYSASENGSLSMLLEKCMQATVYFSSVLAILNFKERKTGLWEMVICCACLLCSYPPTGIARYAAAAIYFGVFLTFFDGIKKSNTFIFILLGAYVLVLPLLNAFRNLAFGDVDISSAVKNITDNFASMWLAGDYDAYTIITLTIDHVGQHGISWLRQLLGVVLFWLPRAIWPGKPVGSGYYVAETLGWSFKNISSPLPAEAYINLGYLGVLLFPIIVGKVIRFLDRCYWCDHTNAPRKIDAIYPVIMMLFFFMCRGDLLSSAAYMAAYVVVGCLLSGCLRNCSNGISKKVIR